MQAHLAASPTLVAVDRDDTGERRWFVRLRGEQKDTSTVWFTLRQRSLHYETYVMPAPEENGEEFYRYLLRRNSSMVGAAFAVGEEQAVFLRGALPNRCVTEVEVDRILGSLFAWVEAYFRPALHIGFASRFQS